MTALARKYKDKDVVWLAINSTNQTTPEANRAFAKKHKLPYPILDDRSGKVGRLFGAITTPHMFIIDKTGVVVYAGHRQRTSAADGARKLLRRYGLPS
jgi:peroxiredoxin